MLFAVKLILENIIIIIIIVMFILVCLSTVAPVSPLIGIVVPVVVVFVMLGIVAPVVVVLIICYKYQRPEKISIESEDPEKHIDKFIKMQQKSSNNSFDFPTEGNVSQLCSSFKDSGIDSLDPHYNSKAIKV